MPDYDRERNRYFVEWVRPQGISDAVTINLERAANSASNLTMGRNEAAGPVTDVELEGLRMLAPHVRRALAISQVLELKTIEAATFVSTLDTLNLAILLVDEDTACIHANLAATTMLNAKYPFTLNGGRLILPQTAATEALREAVRNTATGSLTSMSRGAGIPVSLDDEAPMVLHVMPLLRSEYYHYAEQRATAAIFASPATTPLQMPADALALFYGLTPAESRVFEMLVAGETQSEIALKLGLAISTIKTHLHRVFEKTGCTRQVDLVRLAASLSMPL
jgi:DNA-binding CsgD family transcriptional regulator